ncbi:virulence factor, partial [Salmonella enterica]|nr:virulence factor [Salmonella enterica]
IFIYDFGSKTPQPPASADKKQARKICSSSCSTTKPRMSEPTNASKKENTFSRA